MRAKFLLNKLEKKQQRFVASLFKFVIIKKHSLEIEQIEIE